MKHRYGWSDRENFQRLVDSSNSIMDMLRQAGYKAPKGGGSHKTVYKWAAIHNIELPEWDWKKHGKNKALKNKYSREAKMFVENSTARSDYVKRHIKYHNIFPWVCSAEGCSLSDTWLNKPITLQLDHINGIHNDNRIENLRLLCPNCHSQTDTFAWKNMFKYKENGLLSPSRDAGMR